RPHRGEAAPRVRPLQPGRDRPVPLAARDLRRARAGEAGSGWRDPAHGRPRRARPAGPADRRALQGRAARRRRSPGLFAGQRRLRAQAARPAGRSPCMAPQGGPVTRLLLALLLAYIPSSASLLKHTAQRARQLRSREVTLSGTLALGDEPQRNAQLQLRFPLQCRLEPEGGQPVSVKGTAQNPEGVPEGPSGPALRLLQMACPFIAYRGIPAADAPQALRVAALAAGADVNAGQAVSRLFDRVVF